MNKQVDTHIHTHTAWHLSNSPLPTRAHPLSLFTIVFFLYSNVGKGNECTVAAALTEIPSDDEDEHKQVGVRLQKMVNKTKVNEFRV